MRKMRSILLLVLCFTLLVPVCDVYAGLICPICKKQEYACICNRIPCDVQGCTGYATNSSPYCTLHQKTMENDENATEFASALKIALGKTPSEREIHNFSMIISTLRADGLDNEAIAGILGNMKQESGWEPYAIEGYTSSSKKTVSGDTISTFIDGGTYDFGSTEPSWYNSGAGAIGLGLVQWSHSRAIALDKFAIDNSSKFSYVTVTHWMQCNSDNCCASKSKTKVQRTAHIPNASGQMAFLLTELNGSYSSVKSNLLTATTTDDAADVFLDEFEKPGDPESSRQTRRDWAKKMLPVVQACSGVEGSDGDYNSNSIGSFLYASGVWTEDELSSFCKLTETDIESILDDAKRENLKQDDLSNLIDWENNLEQDKNEDGWISLLRKLVMFIGIVFTVWIMLIYLAYWFDRLNNFFYLDLLSILTFGQLHMSDTEEECTFHIKDMGKGGTKTVNHRAILFICIVGVAFGTLLISGVFYGLIAKLVNTVLGWLS